MPTHIHEYRVEWGADRLHASMLAVLVRRLGGTVVIDAVELAGLDRFDEVEIDKGWDGSVTLTYQRRVELEGEAEEVA